MTEALVRRFQERIRREPTVDYIWQMPPICPRPPLSAEAVAEAEVRLGFPLLPLLRALYTQVGDGGYGPGRGLTRLIEGRWSVVAHVEAIRTPTPGTGRVGYPPSSSQFIPLVTWGSLYRSWVDCSRPPYRVWFDDPDYCVEGASESDYFYPQADSLEDWLTAWLDGVDLWATGKRHRPTGG